MKTVQAYLSEGIPANKIVMGISLFSPSWTLTNPSQTNMGAPANGPGDGGKVNYYLKIINYILMKTL